MREDAFRSWLSNGRVNADGAALDARTIGSRISNCRTVERCEGDLDHQFDQDRLRSLLERLKYSTEDERSNRPARHRIPIEGNIRNGTATLRSAVSLYKQFRENWVEGTPILPSTVERSAVRTTSRAPRSQEQRTWPTWAQPSAEEILAMAHVAVPFVRFLNPDIIRALVEDNERNRGPWIDVLETRGISRAAYLWPGSPCAFPGVRRYAGSREIAAHRGHTRLDENRPLNALALDDNDYPKQIWSFVFRGVQFSKFGPEGYALAHLADHKDHGNRFGQDFEVTEGEDIPRPLFGLYTCPSNTVYIPVSLIKPTDFVGTVRALLVRRAQQLYGSFCSILPPFLRIPETVSTEWNVTEFKWSDPVGTTRHVPAFLEFRNARLRSLIEATGAQ
jgi:hypothetical protein